MRRNYPRGAQRNPMEIYDIIHVHLPSKPGTRRIIDCPRKLVKINLCADPYTATDDVIPRERTCYEDELED